MIKDVIKQFLAKYDKGRTFTWHDFTLLDFSHREFFWGNIRAFGWRFGLTADFGMLCPLYSTIRHYNTRHLQLTFADPETGKELDPLIVNAISCKLKK